MNSVKSSEIIEELLENLRAGTEEIYEKIAVPEVYWVYLHKKDFEEMQQKSDRIVDEAKKALSDEIARLNQAIDIFEKGIVGKIASKSLKIYNHLSSVLRGIPAKHRRVTKKYVEPIKGWQISINADVENRCKEGTILVKSIIQFRKGIELQGNKTMRLVTMRVDGRKIVTQEVIDETEPVLNDSSADTSDSISQKESKPFALIHLLDANQKTTYKMKKETFAVGRGGTTYWVDLPIMNNSKVSQEHLRIRRDEKSGKFFVKDLSKNGTKLNGKKLPSSIEKVDGQFRETDVQTELPNHAKIVLSGVITLEFEILP